MSRTSESAYASPKQRTFRDDSDRRLLPAKSVAGEIVDDPHVELSFEDLVIEGHLGTVDKVSVGHQARNCEWSTTLPGANGGAGSPLGAKMKPLASRIGFCEHQHFLPALRSQ